MDVTERPIRVCMFSYYFPPEFSGAGLYAVSLARQLARREVETFFVTVNRSGLPPVDVHDGFRVYRILDGPRRHGELVLWYNMWRLLRSHRAEFDIIHATGSTYRNSGVGAVARLLGKRSLTVVSMADNDLGFVGRGIAGRTQAWLLGRVDAYVSLSSQITAEIHRLPMDARRAVEIPQGVDVERFAPADESERAALREHLGLPKGPTALYVGVVDRRKNVEWLVRTWAQHRAALDGWRLLLVGPRSRDAADRGLRDDLTAWASAQGLGQEILFRDFTPAIEKVYRAADLFVLPSLNEGMPNVVLEAMACGLPCVVTRISGTADLITHRMSGMLFEVNDSQSFLDAITPLTGDPLLRMELGQQARARVVQGFSTARVAERYVRLYREILGRP